MQVLTETRIKQTVEDRSPAKKIMGGGGGGGMFG